MSKQLLSEASAVLRLQAALAVVASQKAFCDAHGISESQVSATLKGRMAMPPAVAAAIGLEPVRMYRTVNGKGAK